MKELKAFKKFLNKGEEGKKRTRKYTTYISPKLIKNSNLDFQDAFDALFSLNYDESEVKGSIRRTLEEQHPDIADDFTDDLIDLEAALTEVFNVIKHMDTKMEKLKLK